MTDVAVGSKAERLIASKCRPLCARKQPLHFHQKKKHGTRPGVCRSGLLSSVDTEQEAYATLDGIDPLLSNIEDSGVGYDVVGERDRVRRELVVQIFDA
jgi:hypothetical protein